MELCDLDAVQQRNLIGLKEISPVELLDSCIRRIEEVNPRVNAVVATCFERARTEALAAEKATADGARLGALHGLPIGIKDLHETAGLRTTFGSRLYSEYVPEEDERVVAAVRRAGGIVVGKTNVPEFGAGANTVNAVYGPTRNPFDLKRTCGGSSGGSAVALATSMLPLCTGSDTGGSLRIPAAMCGVVGFRPSPGMVPSERRVLGWTPLSVDGPMGRTVGETMLLYSVIIGDDRRDPLSGPLDLVASEQAWRLDLSNLRVAVSEDLGFAAVDQRIRGTLQERVALFDSVFKTCEKSDPAMQNAHEVFAILRAANFLAAHKKDFDQSPDMLGPNVVANYEQGLAMSAADVAWAHAEQTRIYRSFQTFFQQFDVLISPVVSVPPFPVERLYVEQIDDVEMRSYFQWLAPTYGLTLTGHPCIAVPCGVDPTGTPFALQICGAAGADKFVLEVAQALEAYLSRNPVTARPIPDLEALRQSTG